MNKFKVVSKYSPAGDQGKAIEQLSASLKKGTKLQNLK
jgi:excinuclease UvrABC helicase subunit UvrB